MALEVELLSEHLRQQKTNNAEDDNEPHYGVQDPRWYLPPTDLADTKKSCQWLEKTGLQDGTEALIMAPQKQQALSKKSIDPCNKTPGASYTKLLLEQSST